MKIHKIKPGNCISSLAAEHGFDVNTIWNAPANQAVTQKRDNPNILARGDRITIKSRETKQETASSRQIHRFVKKGCLTKLYLKVMIGGEPLAEVAYRFIIDGEEKTGKTDTDGMLEVSIDPTAKEATLFFDDKKRELVLALGALGPYNEVQGVQDRLNNLGYYCGKADGKFGKKTIAAMCRFQQEHDLKVSGEADASTQDMLKALYGS